MIDLAVRMNFESNSQKVSPERGITDGQTPFRAEAQSCSRVIFELVRREESHRIIGFGTFTASQRRSVLKQIDADGESDVKSGFHLFEWQRDSKHFEKGISNRWFLRQSGRASIWKLIFNGRS
jgi:hypothetical protein